MLVKRGLLIILFVLLMQNFVFARTNELYISNSFEINTLTDKPLFFLWSEGILSGQHNAHIIIIDSQCKIIGTIDGNIYAFFSEVTITSEAIVNGQLYEFSSAIIAQFIFSVAIAMLSFLFIAIKRSFFEQGGVVFYHKPFSVLSNGILFYSSILALCVVFLVSVVGFPVALFLIGLLIVFIIAGETSVAIMLGQVFADKINAGTSIHINLLIGIVLLESVKIIPYIGWIFTFFVMPIFSLGILVTSFVDGYIKKVFYNTPYQPYEEQRHNENVRDKILKQIK